MDIIVEITGVGGATNLQALTDVDTSGAVNGQVLTYDGSGWVPTAAAGVTTLAALDDTDVAGITDGQILIYSTATGNFEAGDAPSGGSSAWGTITGTLSAQTDLQAALDAKANTSHTHVKADITDFSDGDYATSAQGLLAGTALQPGDNISTLTNDSGYITSAPVTSVAGKTGIVTLVEADITDLQSYLLNITGESLTDLGDVPNSLVGEAGKLVKVNPTEDGFIYGDPSGTTVSWGDVSGTLSNQTDLQSALDGKATTAQGTLADSATQPGDNVSTLTNDAGYLTSAPVTSVAGKTGVVTLVEADITDLDKYSQSQVNTLLNNYVPNTDRGIASGVATLDGSGTIPNSQLPGLAITSVSTVVDETAQLALTAEEGDVAVRSDQNKSYVHNGGVAGTMADWTELLTPTDAVLSVDGRTGAVSLTDLYATAAQGATADLALQNVSEDTTPQLGGNLDINGFSITSAGAGDTNITCGGSGNVILSNPGAGDILIDGYTFTATKAGQWDTAYSWGDHSLAGYLTSAPVDSVAGKTGVVTLVKADITDFVETDYATGAEGDLATTALQSVADDATPQLGANLDTAGYSITDTNGVMINGETIYDVGTIQTTDATPTVAKTLNIAIGGVTSFTLQGSGYEPVTGDTFGFTLSGCIKNISGTTSIVGATVLTEFKDAGTTAWLIDGVANDTTDQLEITVTGEAAHTINWNFTMRTVEA